MKRNPNPYLLNRGLTLLSSFAQTAIQLELVTGVIHLGETPPPPPPLSPFLYSVPDWTLSTFSISLTTLIFFSEVAPYASTSIPSSSAPHPLYIPPHSARCPLPSGSSEANRKLCTIYIASKGNMPTIKDWLVKWMRFWRALYIVCLWSDYKVAIDKWAKFIIGCQCDKLSNN